MGLWPPPSPPPASPPSTRSGLPCSARRCAAYGLPSGSATMAAVCHTPQATPSTWRPANAATRAGSTRLPWSPCPSLPPKPSPQVKSCPSAVRAAQWKGPHEICSGKKRKKREGAKARTRKFRRKGNIRVGSLPHALQARRLPSQLLPYPPKHLFPQTCLDDVPAAQLSPHMQGHQLRARDGVQPAPHVQLAAVCQRRRAVVAAGHRDHALPLQAVPHALRHALVLVVAQPQLAATPLAPGVQRAGRRYHRAVLAPHGASVGVQVAPAGGQGRRRSPLPAVVADAHHRAQAGGRGCTLRGAPSQQVAGDALHRRHRHGCGALPLQRVAAQQSMRAGRRQAARRARRSTQQAHSRAGKRRCERRCGSVCSKSGAEATHLQRPGASKAQELRRRQPARARASTQQARRAAAAATRCRRHGRAERPQAVGDDVQAQQPQLVLLLVSTREVQRASCR